MSTTQRFYIHVGVPVLFIFIRCDSFSQICMFPWNILLISLIASYKCEQEKDYISYYAKSSKSKENITLGRGIVVSILLVYT
jgi:hypothetical protein